MEDFAVLFNSLPPEKQKALLDGPAIPPPDGITSNFDNPPNQNGLAFAVTTLGLVISSLIVILWILSKAFCQRKVHLGDGFIFAGFCIFTGYSYCLYHWINLTGMYVHAWDVRLRTAFDFAYIVYVGENLYGSTLMTLKIGVLLEWARIFVPTGTRNSFWWLCNATLVANVLFYVAVKLVDNLACFPHEKIWDLTVEGHCINQRASALASAIVNLVSDLVILGLPQMVIWKLNMSFAKRLGVSCIFAVGVFCCVAAIFRVITSYQYYKSIDQVYDLSPVALWDVVEMTLVIVIACLPSIPVIFKDPRIRSLWPLMKSPASSLGKANSSTKLTSHGTVDSSNRNAYQQLEEHSLSTLTANMHGNDLIVKSYGAAAQLSEPTHDQAQMSITLTKSFTTQIDQGDGIAFPSNHDFHIHHPWAKEGV